MIENHRFHSTISPVIKSYLELRQSLGRQCKPENRIFKDLDSFLYKNKKDLTLKSFEGWLCTKQNLSENSRYIAMRIVRASCLYRQRTKSKCFVPEEIWPSTARHQFEPYIFTKPETIRLFDVIKTLKPHVRYPIKKENYRLFLILLYTTGMRRSELCKLTINDYDPVEHTLLIRESKFHKSRIIPISSDGWKELDNYLEIRRKRHLPVSVESPLLWSYGPLNKKGGFYSEGSLVAAFKSLLRAANIKTAYGTTPRLHDLRHTFAVHALLRWYDENIDVQSKLPLLSIYMGHGSIVSTQYYLRFIKDVMGIATKRFEKKYSEFIVKSGEAK